MKNWIQGIGALVLIAIAGLLGIWAFDKVSKSTETTPQLDSTATECCDTTQVCDTTQIYTHETDSCCNH